MSKIDVIQRNHSTKKFNAQHRNQETKIYVLEMTSVQLFQSTYENFVGGC